jgi:hypothetical protein
MKLPSMKFPSSKDFVESLPLLEIPFEVPEGEMPVFPPIVIPPSGLKAPKGVKLEEAPKEKEEEETKTEQRDYTIPIIDIDIPLPSAEVVATATYAAVAAVATTTLATPLFDKLKKQIQKFLQKKVDKWKENRQKKKKKDSSES